MDQGLESTSPSDWKYLAEGGSTVVFTYNGPYNAKFNRCVLRIRKSFEDKPEGATDEDDLAIEFQRRVTSKLLDHEWLPRLESISIEASWLQELDSLSRDHRPPERQSSPAGSIDLNLRKAVLSENLIGGHGWAAEIKVIIILRNEDPSQTYIQPKWGFLPNPEHLSAETRDTKLNHCRFCLHRYQRSLQHQKTSEHYCPLDLFSGETGRIKQALSSLWDSWKSSEGHSNNLRLFSAGQLVDPCNEISLNHLRTSIKSSLPPSSRQNSSVKESFVEASLSILSRSPVLNALSRLQRSLDPLDIEGLYSLSQSPKSVQSAMHGEPSLEEWETFINNYLDPVFQASLDHRDPDPANLRYYALAYLLSASFKDCSIILRFLDGPETPPAISVIDLDVKSIERLKKWKNLDYEIATCFACDGPPDSKCRDAHSL
ncbi:hypothetical protein SCHPADRAFT_935555 [Schizopora paradoxa]|uniref:Inositol-pentakisphosphate 2-kinase n=1 Tax=Schizopora paradoxa TaxID=27342 RepID=A0A0H2SBX2_9AGAM|nr:hypothetical protein SCHPADRAFT_935555 [Schizopora paradoxa]